MDLGRIYKEYLQSKRRGLNDRKKRYSKIEIVDIKRRFDAEVKQISNLMRASFTEDDISLFVSQTCALSIMKPTHTMVDEMGTVGHGFTRVPYNEKVIEEVIKFYSRTSSIKRKIGRSALLRKDVSGYGVSVPRGKSSGWPIPIPGMKRSENNLISAAYALLVEYTNQFNRKVKPADQVTLEMMASKITQITGVDFQLIFGERYQHTDKEMPLFPSDAPPFSAHLAPKARIISQSSRLAVIWNRYLVKTLMNDMLRKSPAHDVDRAQHTANVRKYLGQGWVPFSLDQSKHDWRHGGDILRTIVERILGSFLEENAVSDIKYECFAPLLFPNGSDVVLDQRNDILASGVSITTIAGSIASTLDLFELLMEYCNIPEPSNSYGKLFWYLAWGDDMLVFLHPSLLNGDSRELFLEKMTRFYELKKLKITDEGRIAFLGADWDDVKQSFALRPYRFVQTTLYPERLKFEPVWHLAIAMKLDAYPINRDLLLKFLSSLSTIVKQRFKYTVRPTSYYVGGVNSQAFKDGVAWVSKHKAEAASLEDALLSAFRMEDLEDIYEILGLGEDVRGDITLDTALNELTSEARAYANKAQGELKKAVADSKFGGDFCIKAVNAIFNRELEILIKTVTY